MLVIDFEKIFLIRGKVLEIKAVGYKQTHREEITRRLFKNLMTFRLLLFCGKSNPIRVD